ncbi:MAG: DsbA family protein [bacterium]
MEENIIENKPIINKNEGQKQLAGAIIIAGVLIAGAILLKPNAPSNNNPGNGLAVSSLAPISKNDRILGNPKAKVALVLYEDFQCPFCGAVSGLSGENTDAVKYLKSKVPSWAPFMPVVNDYVKNGTVELVYRDFVFLGPESIRAAEAARCAGEQGKFWEYHDYLYGHQGGENKGAFSDANLKIFAKNFSVGTDFLIDGKAFDNCLDTGKYAQAVNDEKDAGSNAGVTGTPKAFILKDGRIFATIEGAEPASSVKQKLDNALK